MRLRVSALMQYSHVSPLGPRSLAQQMALPLERTEVLRLLSMRFRVQVL